MSALLSAPIGFVGLGVMGEPMCAHLTARAKGPVLVHDLRDDAVSRAVAAGARAAGSLAGLRTQAQVVFLCLADGEATRETCRALSEPASEVRLVIDCGTTSVALTQSLAGELAEYGIEFADAPMARMRQAARAGSLSFMVGAAPDVFTRIEPLLATMGSDILHCGPVGSGQVVKTMNNMVLFETVHALALSVRVCRKLGVDPRTLLTALGHGSADSGRCASKARTSSMSTFQQGPSPRTTRARTSRSLTNSPRRPAPTTHCWRRPTPRSPAPPRADAATPITPS
ncbi:NAD(P)-dependent oxidoreductase [Streptomyces iranensis]|uniref:3-hydroxyisobutyrate dehydrogenase-like beta-hydroxyacid dehydrogenase n=1 Tax=Streptomyces iranensis TaxID=576784 RepID=A0A061A671_9ACTN|nr:NAD(P)-dependent oxidoreductase [Streptomyces iranensis]MBP2066152.1 3-hydroxyisobutyrate dehydrogenase-like beta-hydroxyacid dehydrogenase [Streptomyces iranensis]CDR13199.1 6-phosphogluconate dehydrogenase NAD-bindingprotein [Streptomyces iranensis]